MNDAGAGRSTRTRIVLAAALPLAVALVIGTVAVAALFARGRVDALDRQTLAETDVLRGLLTTGQLPGTLPLPTSSSLLAQVLDSGGGVVSSSPSASRVQPLVTDPRAGVMTDEAGAYSGAPLRVRTTDVSAGAQKYVVVVAAPLSDVRAALHALRTVLLLVVPLLLLLTTAVIWWATGLALRPVAALLESQRAFIADAAHELRSPVTSLVVQLDVASAYLDPGDVPSFVEDLKAEVGRLATLTDDLLLLARLDGVALPMSPVDLREVVGEAGPAILVHGNAQSLRRLLDNLTSNAGRYAGRVEVHIIEQPDCVQVTVDDDGPGIPVHERERVFHRWVRLDESRTRTDGGTGLGLAVARAIAHQHGGTLTAHDSPLGGARMTLTLPISG